MCKKVFAFLISVIILMLCGCSDQYSAKLIDNNKAILYNGATYNLIDNRDFLNYYEDAIYSSKSDYKAESRSVGIAPFIIPKAIVIYFEEDFGDNVLCIHGVGYAPSFYLKEGFEFPDYRDVVISRLCVSESHRVYDDPDEADVIHSEKVDKFFDNCNFCLNDVIDFTTPIILSDNASWLCQCYGILRDYSTFLLGDFMFILHDGTLYYRHDSYFSGDLLYIDEEPEVYKVKEEYQQMFRDLLIEANDGSL